MNLILKGSELINRTSYQECRNNKKAGDLASCNSPLKALEEHGSDTTSFKRQTQITSYFRRNVQEVRHVQEMKCNTNEANKDACSSTQTENFRMRTGKRLDAILAMHRPNKQRIESWAQSIQQLLSDNCIIATFAIDYICILR